MLCCLLPGDEEGSGGDQDSDNPLVMLFSEIHHFTDPTGRALSEPFLRLPSRRFVKLLYFSLAEFILETSYWDRWIIHQTDILSRYKSENRDTGFGLCGSLEREYYQKQ